MIVNDLKSQRLITVEIKKWFFVFKKTEAFITETGKRILNSKIEELSYKSQKLQQLYETGNRTQMQSYMKDNRSWIPMMLFSGLIKMVMFAFMMSFMGTAMNPVESAQTEGQVDQSGGAEESAGTGAEDAGAAAVTGETGGFSETGFDDGSGGMNTGGFDSF